MTDNDKYKLDPYEQELEDAFEKEGIKPVTGERRRQIEEMTVQAARNYLRKDQRINIRLSSADLQRLKMRASREGLPYQTMIAGILHKVAAGLLDDKL